MEPKVKAFQKVDVAQLQLDAAIKAYFNGDFIITITLAGASNGILGEMVKRQGLQTAVEKIAAIDNFSNYIKDLRARIGILNKIRNNIKHASDQAEDELEISEYDPFFEIIKSNVDLRSLKIEGSECVKKFVEIHNINK